MMVVRTPIHLLLVIWPIFFLALSTGGRLEKNNWMGVRLRAQDNLLFSLREKYAEAQQAASGPGFHGRCAEYKDYLDTFVYLR